MAMIHCNREGTALASAGRRLIQDVIMFGQRPQSANEPRGTERRRRQAESAPGGHASGIIVAVQPCSGDATGATAAALWPRQLTIPAQAARNGQLGWLQSGYR